MLNSPFALTVLRLPRPGEHPAVARAAAPRQAELTGNRSPSQDLPLVTLTGPTPAATQTGTRVDGNGRRIALVIHSLGPGGAERVLTTLAAAWAKRGDAVTIITVASPAADFFGVPVGVQRRWLDTERTGGSLARIKKLREEIQAMRPDVVISFVDGINILVLLATAGLGVATVVAERTDPRQHHLSTRNRLLRRMLYPRADALVVQTAGLRSWALGFVRRESAVAIPNPLCSPPLDVPAPGDRQKRVVAIGRLTREKGVDILLHAAAIAVLRHPDWEFWIYGEGPERTSLLQLAERLGIRNSVHFAGLTSEPETVLQHASIFVLPSRYEGFPNALVEAMAAGAAVVAADCASGPAEIIHDGIDGRLVPVEDPHAMASAIGELIRSPAERDRLGTQARAVRERYAVTTVLDRWDQVIDRCLAAGPG